MRGENYMLRKFILSVVMLIPLVGAAASHVAIPVVVVMGILAFFVISVSGVRSEIKDEKT
jgi:hypothetical protein